MTKNDTRETIRDLLAKGFTPRAIAEKLGITTQAVYLQMAVLREEAERV